MMLPAQSGLKKEPREQNNKKKSEKSQAKNTPERRHAALFAIKRSAKDEGGKDERNDKTERERGRKCERSAGIPNKIRHNDSNHDDHNQQNAGFPAEMTRV